MGDAPDLLGATSFLFVPATHPDRVAKAARSSAHAVIVDLEDSVAPADKEGAREELTALRPERPLLVRVNDPASTVGALDVEVLGGLEWLAGVVVPKAESRDDIGELITALPAGTPVIALVESARGLQRIEEIAASGVVRLCLGSADYLAEIGAEASAEVLSHPRTLLVVASAAARIAPPVDGPTLVVDDLEVLAADLRAARSLGIAGKLCIHPSQLEAVHQAFAPTPEERAWATRVIDAAAADRRGVLVVDGQMVDAPVLARARRLLARGPG